MALSVSNSQRDPIWGQFLVLTVGQHKMTKKNPCNQAQTVQAILLTLIRQVAYYLN